MFYTSEFYYKLNFVWG